MKFFLDENISARVARSLRERGFDAVHAIEAGLNAASDTRILDFCRAEERVVVTMDADFHGLLALSGAAAPSVVRIRIDRVADPELVNLLAEVIGKFGSDLAAGAAVTIKSTSVRVHALPLRSREDSREQ